MKRTEAVELTTMCMIQDGRNVLVQNRNDKTWPGIAFPGGHVEAGESFTDAVIREVQEETGLTIISPSLCGVKNWYGNGYRYLVLFYRTNRFSGQLRSSAEGTVWWEPLDNLLNLPLANDMDTNLKLFLEDDLSELYYRQSGDVWLQELK